ncbi:AtpZ/AtpI family protein [Eisenibacter elegans]|jgi:F0F1-type ATP synthase assembly protein I|uniref:AtpZ/AtpI family protein n=1 Tax=Eisenibacter elegans TaxID=997 RepID=UPI00047EC983|nr:AtpZ/AtpI family protein [Eisenibacter elegans]
MPSQPNKPPLNDYAKYSGLAFQMAAVIGLSLWVGMQLDKYLGLAQPLFTVLFILMGVVGAMLWLIRSLQG